jgi:methoxymalonate biosynthesis acyl carrier protein
VSGRDVQADAVRKELTGFLSGWLKSPVAADTDIFATGLVSSLFALELVLHLENAFGVEVQGPELKLDNFRTVEAMTALVVRLSGAAGAGSHAGTGANGA